ncbi:MAG: LysM peptidoglycan-binding domain-containing protein [Bacteroidales bacterium]|jgi:LysM repeat protein|nr:LysM peptidoglycan-binding domain-containing protein [Bacteroidales bacterium]
MEEDKRYFSWWRAAAALIIASQLLPVTLAAQTQTRPQSQTQVQTQTPAPVTISGEKIVVEGKVYYMHQVQKGQTLYSIARAYTVTVDLLTRENAIADNGIKEGQVLRIPAAAVAQGQVAAKSAQANARQQQGGEPGGQVGGQPQTAGAAARAAGQVTQPARPPANQDERYIYHRVMRGETLGTIAGDYGISVRDLKRANKGLLFPHEGDVLLIPRNKISSANAGRNGELPAIEIPVDTVAQDTIAAEEEKEVFTLPGSRTEIDRLHGSVRVAVLLPFFLRENSAGLISDSTLSDTDGNRNSREQGRSSWIYDGSLPFLEAYEGILIAVDSLRSLGLTVELDVFDTGADTTGLHRLILSGSLDGADLIIGPVFSYHIEQIAGWAAERDIPIVSPVTLRNRDITLDKPTLYRVFPSESVFREIMAREVKSHPESKVIFLHSDSSMYNPATSALWRRVTEATGGDTAAAEGRLVAHHYTGVTQKRNVYGNVSTLEELMDPARENIIVLATTETPIVSSAFSALHSLKKRYDIKVLGYPEIRGLETIDLKYYYDLELLIPSECYVDFLSPATQSFSSLFMKKFRTEPMAESFAWRGFDIAWYFIGGIAYRGKEFLRDPGTFNPALLCLEPDFRRDSRQNGYENKGIFILHYRRDMTIEIKRPWSEPAEEEVEFQSPFRRPFPGSSGHNREQ